MLRGVSKVLTRSVQRSPHRYHIADWEGKIIVMSVLKFYGDESFGRRESGSNGCYAVAGLLTSSDVWKDMTDDWQYVLNAAPAIKYFHMSECYSAMASSGDVEQQGEFYGMRPADARQKLDALVSAVEKYGPLLAAASSITTWDIFRHALPPVDQAQWKNPYFPCVMNVVWCIRGIFRKLESSMKPVSFVFDDRTDSKHLLEAWTDIKQMRQAMAKSGNENTDLLRELGVMKSITFTDDKTCLPLQCADLLAWHVRRDYVKPSEDKGKTRPEYSRIKKCIAAFVSDIDSEQAVRDNRIKVWRDAIEYASSQSTGSTAP
jgi:hypothetical protein